MKKGLILIIILALGALTAWQILYHPDSDQVSSLTKLSPTGALSPAPQSNGLKWNNELQIKIPTPSDNDLPGVEPFLAHQFESAPKYTRTPEPTVVPRIPSSILLPTSPPAETADPVIQGLRELAQVPEVQHDSSRVFGLRSNTGGNLIVPTSTPNPEVTGTPTADFPRVSGLTIGYTMLYLMQPKARQTVEHELQTLLNANVESGYLGTLVDGTFGNDFGYLESVVRRLNHEGRRLTLALYLTNGPTMRRFASTPIRTAFSQIDPIEFRFLISFDPPVRNQFSTLANRARLIFNINSSLNPANKNIAIVMLEDNLDDESYRRMRQLAQSSLGSTVQFMRNPCKGCYDGNESFTFGDGTESHSPGDVATLESIDGFTMDGIGFESPGDELSGQMSLESAKALKLQAMARNIRYFGIWRKQRQGLGTQLIHPDNRVYEVPTETQQDAEIDLLRFGMQLAKQP